MPICPKFLTIRPASTNLQSNFFVLPSKTYFGIKQCKSHIVNSSLQMQFLGCIKFQNICKSYQWNNDTAKSFFCSQHLQQSDIGFCLIKDDNIPHCDYLYICFSKKSIKPNIISILNDLNKVCTFNNHKITDVNLLILLYGQPSLSTSNTSKIRQDIETMTNTYQHQKPKKIIHSSISPCTSELVFSNSSDNSSNIKVTGS